MDKDRENFGLALGLWAAVPGAVLAGAIAVLLAIVPVWGWIALILFLVLWGTALLSFTDPASRAFLAGTLRKSTYTQIYTTLARRTVMRLWTRLCDPAEDPAGVGALFRAALTWRLYDAALLIAVAYPIMLLVGQWIVTGQDGRIGEVVVLEAAPFWWDRAVVLGAFTILMLGFVARKLLSGSRHLVVRLAADWLLLAAGVVAVSFVGTLAIVGVVAGAGVATFAVAGAGVAAMAVSFGGVVAGVVASAVVLALAITQAFAVAFGGTFAVAGVVAVAFGGAGVVVFGAAWLHARGRQHAGRWLITGAVTAAAVSTLILLDFSAVTEDRRTFFLFLAVLPLLNALFDTLSYAVTLTLMRRGLRSVVPWL